MKHPVRVSGSFAYHAAKAKPERQGCSAREDVEEEGHALAVAAAVRMTISTRSEREAKRQANEAAQEMIRFLSERFPDIGFSHLKTGDPVAVKSGSLIRKKG